jgi:hypothetical protein
MANYRMYVIQGKHKVMLPELKGAPSFKAGHKILIMSGLGEMIEAIHPDLLKFECNVKTNLTSDYIILNEDTIESKPESLPAKRNKSMGDKISKRRTKAL